MAIPIHYPSPGGATPHEQLLNCCRDKVAVSAEEEVMIRATFKERHFARNEHILRVGEICPFSVYIVRGVMRDYTTDADGVEQTTRLAFDDYFSGDMHSLSNGVASVYSIQCLEETVGLTIDKAGYDWLFAQVPAFTNVFHYVRNRSFNVALQLMAERSSKSAEQRYLGLLRENPQIFQRVPLKIIASWMGIQPETLSRIRKNITL
ncbi:Crp/Fnr family transcriptional regulator [Hymenobacter saemangeumensis]|uniref:Crp/Fnr family transcriptional regulator n=1 Tax=Hymenobacter saemangeumensis TaxID=1084522 RepID=A0ABP8I495_9BACT